MKKNIYSLIKNAARKYNDKPALSTKIKGGKYKSISYSDLENMTDSFASGLIELGVKSKGFFGSGDKIAIMSENRTEFIIADLANYAIGATSVLIYNTYTPKKIKEILEDSGAKTIIISNKENYEKIKEISGEVKLERIISMEKLDDTIYFNEIMRKGKEKPADIDKISKSVKDSDLAVLMYTSGTTGKPKGAMLTHGNITSNMETLNLLFPELSSKERALSLIPYSHALEHTGTLTLLSKGLEIGFAESPATVAEDLINFRPSVMLAVPRLYEKVLDKIELGLASSKIKKRLFEIALRVKEIYTSQIENGQTPIKLQRFLNKVFDHLVFQKIRDKTGGNLKFCITGGGPLSPKIEHLFSDMIGIKLYNGYGLTETSPVIAVNTLKNNKKGTIGKPIPGAEVKIINGEIAVSGPMVFSGYWKAPEKTKEILAKKNGKTYLLTGDKGKLDKEGYLYIMGRMKNDIRLNTGQNIGLAEELEEPLLQSGLITQIMVHGQAEPYITGLIVPNFEYIKTTTELNKNDKVKEDLENILKSFPDLTLEHTMPFNERMNLALNKKTYELLTQKIDEINEKIGLEDYARLKTFVVLPTEFTEKSGLLTPTMKLKRNDVLKYYEKLFKFMYPNKR